jgi:hypothetical protein
MEVPLDNVYPLGSSVRKLRPAALTLTGRLYLKCCTIAFAGSNAPLGMLSSFGRWVWNVVRRCTWAMSLESSYEEAKESQQGAVAES